MKTENNLVAAYLSFVLYNPNIKKAIITKDYRLLKKSDRAVNEFLCKRLFPQLIIDGDIKTKKGVIHDDFELKSIYDLTEEDLSSKFLPRIENSLNLHKTLQCLEQMGSQDLNQTYVVNETLFQLIEDYFLFGDTVSSYSALYPFDEGNPIKIERYYNPKSTWKSLFEALIEAYEMIVMNDLTSEVKISEEGREKKSYKEIPLSEKPIYHIEYDGNIIANNTIENEELC